MVKKTRALLFCQYKEDFFCCCWKFEMSSFSLPLSKFQLLTLSLSFLSPTGMKVRGCISQMSGRLGEDTLCGSWLICCHHKARSSCSENCISHCHIKLCNARYLVDTCHFHDWVMHVCWHFLHPVSDAHWLLGQTSSLSLLQIYNRFPLLGICRKHSIFFYFF